MRMNFLGLFPFTAPYLPWVLFGFSFLLGNSPVVDMMGIAAGHIYFYFDDVYPEVARIRGWPVRYYLRAPEFLSSVAEDEIIGEAEEYAGVGRRLQEEPVGEGEREELVAEGEGDVAERRDEATGLRERRRAVGDNEAE